MKANPGDPLPPGGSAGGLPPSPEKSAPPTPVKSAPVESAPVKSASAASKRKKGKEAAAAEEEEEIPEPKMKKSEAAAAVVAPPSPASSGAPEAVHSWCVEYAKSGRSTCQATKNKIEQGAVRIGKEVDNTFRPGTRMFVWYLPGPLFDLFRKGSENKPRIKSVDELVGFEDLKASDAAELESLIMAESAAREKLTEAEGDTDYFLHPDGKFWSILVAGNTTRVKWGKIGEDAVLSEKQHANEAAAEKFKDKMIKEKTSRGYVKQ